MKALDMYCDKGLTDIRPDSNYDSVELYKGKLIELEHTDCPIKASIIAKDHLDEIPDYYTRLQRMEEDAKKDSTEKSIHDLVRASK